MKALFYILLITTLPLFLQGQYTWDRHSVSATGGQQSTSTFTTTTTVQHYEASQLNNSTYSGNTGFLFPETILLDIVLDVKAILEGPFNGTNMNTTLYTMDQIPLSQPYNTSPWNYSGTETISSIPNANVVDWVLIEIRDATNAISANASTIVEQQAAFLLSNGSVVGIDGSSMLSFNHSLIHSLFIVVHHRNHLSIMSANPLIKTNGVYGYDFTNSASQDYGDNQTNLSNGYFGMVAGDINVDGFINQDDFILWKLKAGQQGYLMEDLDLNSQVENIEKNDYWLPNVGKSEILPE